MRFACALLSQQKQTFPLCLPTATYPGLHAQIPGVPVMYLQAHRYTIERLPEATLGGAPRT